MNRRLTLVLTAVALTGTGCSTFPPGGPVNFRPDQDQAGTVDDPQVRIIPSRPQDGWQPEKVVEGFLTAMGDRDDVDLLSSYLVPGATFEPQPEVDVIADPETGTLNKDFELLSQNEAVVTVHGDQTGQITSAGLYTARTQKDKEYTFKLRQITPGHWRIISRPSQLVLRGSAVERSYRTTKLYFFAPDDKVLVPRWVFLPLSSRASRPSKLVEALLKSDLSADDSVRTAIPRDTGLTEPVQQTDDGTVTVGLSKQAASGKVHDMAAQILWTLRQVPGLQNIRLKINGKIVRGDTGKEIQEQTDFQQVDPDEPGRNATPYALTPDGRIAQLTSPESPLPAFPGRVVEKPAGSIGGEPFVSAVWNRSMLVSAPGSTTYRTVLTVGKGKNLLRPSWDRNGNLWIVARKDDGTDATLHVWHAGMEKAVEVPWSQTSPMIKVDALRVARDGVRVALLISNSGDPAIQMAEIRQSGEARTMSDFRTINAELASVSDLSWLNADTLAVLGKGKDAGASVVPYQVPVSGGRVQLIGGSIPGTPMTITASPTKILIGVMRSNGDDDAASVVIEQDYSDQPQLGQWSELEASKGVTAPVFPG